MASSFIPTVFWLTGLSGAGKTTVAKILATSLRARGEPTIFLDGDELRAIFNHSLGYDKESRFEASKRYAHLCKMLVKQDTHVICATISLFHETQRWSREQIPNYFEVFLNVPINVLIQRNNKCIYSDSNVVSKKSNIVGIDVAPEFPLSPDLVINNDGSHSPEHSANIILSTYISQKNLNSQETVL